jgi:hypothetical protein
MSCRYVVALTSAVLLTSPAQADLESMLEPIPSSFMPLVVAHYCEYGSWPTSVGEIQSMENAIYTEKLGHPVEWTAIGYIEFAASPEGDFCAKISPVPGTSPLGCSTEHLFIISNPSCSDRTGGTQSFCGYAKASCEEAFEKMHQNTPPNQSVQSDQPTAGR